MMFVGSIDDKGEAEEVMFIAKVFVTGNRARLLGLKSTNKENDKVIDELISKLD